MFLTNTLEPIEPQKNLLLPAVSAEVEAAQKVKEKPILVITGNPPYSGHSRNKGAWITAQVKKYREGFPELSKPAQGKWLQDDYVKFVRFAQLKMDQVDRGIVAIITNHSWLDNPTFKGMRKSLLETFNHLYVIDLHGNAKKKERAQYDSNDENVFDIEQGVSVALFAKGTGLDRIVRHTDLWGRRQWKYEWLARQSIKTVQWTELSPDSPDWQLQRSDEALAVGYLKYWSVRDIFSPSGDPAPGIVTTQDEFAISFEASQARDKVKRFLSTSTEAQAREQFRLCTQNQWNYERAKEELPSLDLRKFAVPLIYRPFDVRWTIWN